MGSAGAKAMAIVPRGNADIYFHSGGRYEWGFGCSRRSRKVCRIACLTRETVRRSPTTTRIRGYQMCSYAVLNSRNKRSPQ